MRIDSTLVIISTMLMFATTAYASESAKDKTIIDNAIAVMKDEKGNTVGLATFTENAAVLSAST